MKLKEKINTLGQIVADINLNVTIIKREINQIKKWMLDPETLAVDNLVYRKMNNIDHSDRIKEVTKEKGLHTCQTCWKKGQIKKDCPDCNGTGLS